MTGNRRFAWALALLLLPSPIGGLALASQEASVVVRPGVVSPPLDAYFDLGDALSVGVNQSVKIIVSAYNTQKTAVKFKDVYLINAGGAMVGVNVAKADALQKDTPVGFIFQNFGVSPAKLKDVVGVRMTFISSGGDDPTDIVKVSGVQASVIRDVGESCVSIDPNIIEAKEKPLLTADQIQNAGRTPTAVGSGGSGGGGGGTPSSQGPSELQTKSDYCPSGCSGSWTEAAYWHTSTAANSPSSYLRATGGGFNVPVGGTITGVKLIITKHGESNIGEEVFDSAIRLIKGSVISGENKALMTAWPASDTNFVYGGTGDMWGLSLTPADVNAASGFGAAVNVVGGTTGNADVLSMNMTIYYSTGASIYDAFTDLLWSFSRRAYCLVTWSC